MNVIEKSAPPAGTTGPTGPVVSTGRLSPAEVHTLAARFKQALHGDAAPVIIVDGRAIPVTPADEPATPGEVTTNQAQSRLFTAHFGTAINDRTDSPAERVGADSSRSKPGAPWFRAESAMEPGRPEHLPAAANPTAAAPATPDTHGAAPALHHPTQPDVAGPTLTVADQPATPPSAMVTTNQVTIPLSEESAVEPTDEPADNTLGAAMLQSLLQQSSNAPAPVQATTAPAAPTSRVQSLESVVAETVSRVLVSDPLHDGRREVRIEFAKEVLPDTQVRLWRDAGRLHIEFTSPPAVAERGLQEALPRLGDAIQQRHTESTAPVVTLRAHGFDTGGQPGDGRSRQRYRTQEEVEGIA